MLPWQQKGENIVQEVTNSNNLVYAVDLERLIETITERVIKTFQQTGSAAATRSAPRMRTAAECEEYFIAADPETPIRKRKIAKWIRDGKLPYSICGNKKLVNLDLLIEKISSGDLSDDKPGVIEQKEEPMKIGERRTKIRAIPE